MASASVDSATSSIPAEGEVREQLERILLSPEFRLPERTRRFLEFVVAETLAGRRDYLKAFTIAQAVFGRDANFDAQQDPCVRIEAGRLRRELEHYYLTDGSADRVIITVPRGGYAPVFDVRQEAADEDVEPARASFSGDDGRQEKWVRRGLSSGIADQNWPLVRYRFVAGGALLVLVAASAMLHGWEFGGTTPPAAVNHATILVEPFESASEGRLASDISRGITDDVIEKLVPFNDIVVVAALPKSRSGQAAPEPLYALQGSVRLEGSTLRSTARLMRRADGAVIWANNYDADMKVQGILKTQASLADDIVTAVARPFGVMFQTNAASIAGSTDAFSCTLSYYSYRTELTLAAHDATKACLQQAIEKAPESSNAAAFLSLTYLDEFRFPYQLNTKPDAETLKLAKDLAQRAVQLDPKNARALQALMLADFFENDNAGAMRAGAAAYAINPNDTEVAGEYGVRLSMSGEWDKGCALVSEAVSKNAGPRGYYEVGMALCAFMRGDTQAAELWSRMSDLDYNPMHRLVLLAILGTLGKKDEAATQLTWLKTRSPALIPNVRREIGRRLARPEDQERFFAGLAAAGLPLDDRQVTEK